ncbi:MAG: NAD+ synthase, partial [Candidatus Terrybacteria bacterium]|nr:NAD+ synthase [Candidatus Terrybacteria bacterium]
MRVALLQQNFLVGDITGNAAKIREGYRRALHEGADLVVSTELSLLGYPPRDLLERRDVIAAQLKALEALAKEVSETPLIVGFAEPNRESRGAPLFNAAALLRDGKIADVQRKALLPTYDVFDEHRYFESWSAPQEPVMISGKRVAILICEDIWNGIEDPVGRRRYREDPVEVLAAQGEIDALVVLNGSPYFWGKGDARFSLAGKIAQKLHAPVFYANQVGGNDELIFDGRSFAVNAQGECIGAASAFQEDLFIIDSEGQKAKEWKQDTGEFGGLRDAFIMGLRDYVEKVGAFPGGAVLGLSGGIDSSLVACLAAEALGPDRVLGIAMPSPHSSKESVEDAEILARNLGIGFRVVPIAEAFSAYRGILESIIGWKDPYTITEENLQARIRGMILMAIANREKRIVLGTGNKSELAVGYATLYGDMAAGLGVISDLPKMEVYALSRFLNRDRRRIPERVLTKAPSAELRPGQQDTDSLPPYENLDPLLHAYIEEWKGPKELISEGFDAGLVERVLAMVDRAEFKRRQAAPGLKVTTKAFGSGRRLPIAA